MSLAVKVEMKPLGQVLSLSCISSKIALLTPSIVGIMIVNNNTRIPYIRNHYILHHVIMLHYSLSGVKPKFYLHLTMHTSAITLPLSADISYL